MNADLLYLVRSKFRCAGDAIDRAMDSQNESYILDQLQRAQRWLAEAEKLIRESAGVKFTEQQ